MSIGNVPEIMSQHILVGIVLVGRLGVGLVHFGLNLHQALACYQSGRSSADTSRMRTHPVFATGKERVSRLLRTLENSKPITPPNPRSVPARPKHSRECY